MHAVARLARLSVADVIGKNDEITIRIEQLPRPKQHIGELGSQELLAGTSGSMEDHYRIRHPATRVTCRLAESPVVQPQLGECLA